MIIIRTPIEITGILFFLGIDCKLLPPGIEVGSRRLYNRGVEQKTNLCETKCGTGSRDVVRDPRQLQTRLLGIPYTEKVSQSVV